MDLEVLDFDLPSTLEEAESLLAAAASEKGLDLRSSIDSDVPLHLLGDQGKLRQIIVNLLSNAVKFTSKGKIQVHVCLISPSTELLHLARESDVSCRMKDCDVTLRFSVSDTGIGIPEDRVKILFSPFTQVDSSTTRKYGGTGLGLAISRQLAELMGGRIGVASQEGEGSTFWFTANFKALCKGCSGSTNWESKKNKKNNFYSEKFTQKDTLEESYDSVRILVAEDNLINQKVAQAIIKKMGYEVDIVGNGQETINALQLVPYSLVLMDCQMPEMDGFEATRRIRQEGSMVLNPNIPIIAMTASAMSGDREKCIRAGMDDFIAKPVRKEELEEMLTRWLREKKNISYG